MRRVVALAVCLLFWGCGDSSGPDPDVPPTDAGTSVRDAGSDAGDLTPDAGVDAGTDAGVDAGVDAGTDAGVDAGTDAGVDAGTDAGTDAGVDAGSCVPQCDGRQCGSDGCGGTCGTCNRPPPSACLDSNTRESFSGGLCLTDTGQCYYDSARTACAYGCEAATCQSCQPQCDGRTCGDDGCGGSCGTCEAPDTCGGGGVPGVCGQVTAACGAWTDAGVMNAGRAHPATAMLADGRWLVAGGLWGGSSTRRVEAYDPDAGTWVELAAMPKGSTAASETHPYYSHPGGALLGNGQVYVSGYADGMFALYNPDGGTWTSINYGIGDRLSPIVFQLPDGRALLAGGENEGGYFQFGTAAYSPAGTWDYFGAVTDERYEAAGAVLSDGRVLLVSGYRSPGLTRSAELYDTTTRAWRVTGAPLLPRRNAAVVRLADDRVLLIGGGTTQAPVASVELYDPTTGRWRLTGALHVARAYATATLLSDGRVLVAGGRGAGGVDLPWVEVFDPATEQWTLTAPLSVARSEHMATQLRDGRVLVAGGTGASATRTEAATPASFCAGAACTPESNEALCLDHAASCGMLTVKDACGFDRRVNCGYCTIPATCGGGGVPNRCGVPQASGWLVEKAIDADPQFRPSLVLGRDGEPTLAAIGYNQSDFTFELHVGGRHPLGWNWSPVRRGLKSPAHSNPLLALSPSGAPRAVTLERIVTSTVTTAPVLHGWEAPYWKSEALTSVVNAPTYALSLAVGPSDEAWLCGLSMPSFVNQGALYCLSRGSTGWRSESIATVGNMGNDMAVAVDRAGVPQVVYRNANSGDLLYSVRGAAGWTTKLVDTGLGEGVSPSLAVDAEGRPQLSYYDTVGKTLRHASWDGGSWYVQTVDASGDVGRGSALALDAQGRARISYQDVARKQLKVARWTGTAWALTTVDASQYVGGWSSIAVDASGRTHVAYTDESNRAIRYAREP